MSAHRKKQVARDDNLRDAGCNQESPAGCKCIKDGNGYRPIPMKRMDLLVASFPTKAVCARCAVCARKLDQSVPLRVAEVNASRVNAGSLNALPCIAI